MADRGPPPGSSIIVPIQPAGSKPPLVWVGLCPEVMHLKQALGPDRPLLAISIESLERQERLADYAQQIAAALCSEFPRQAYLVGGTCTFGVLAYETAAQLRTAGKGMSLVLIDAVNPAKFQPGLGWIVWIDRLVFNLRQLIRHGNGDRPKFLRAKLRRLLGCSRLAKARASSWTDGPIRADIEQAAYGYSASMLDCNMLFLQPEEHAVLDDRAASWNDTARGQIEIWRIPGSHTTMMQHPRGKLLAERIASSLN